MKKISILLTLAILVSVIAMGCGSNANSQAPQNNVASSEVGNAGQSSVSEAPTASPDEPIVLKFLTTVGEYPKFNQEINDNLHKTFPNISLEIENPSGNQDAILKTKMASGEGYDIFEYQGYNAIKAFADAGYLLDLTDTDLPAMVQEAYRNSGTYNGRIYGIPTLVQGFGLIYNKTAFDEAGIAEPPKTIQDFREACEKLKNVNITPCATGFADFWVAEQMLWGIQGAVLDDPQKFYDDMNSGARTVKDDKLDRAFELLDIYYQNCGDNPLNTDFSGMSRDVSMKKAGMAISGDWVWPEAEKVNPDTQLGMGPIPVSENPDDAAMIVDVAAICYIYQNSQYIDAAKDVVKWLVTKEGAEATGGKFLKRQSPSVENPVVDLCPLDKDAFSWEASGKKTAYWFMWSFWPSGLGNTVGNEMQNYIAGTTTREQFYKAFDDMWQQLKTD